MEEDQSLQETREQVRLVLVRAVAEPEYAKALRSDPGRVLGEAGVIEPIIEDLTRELRLAQGPFGWSSPGPETECAFTCDGISCIVTICGCVPFST
jgi:hypothetical protein